jgi:hypothetical protein
MAEGQVPEAKPPAPPLPSLPSAALTAKVIPLEGEVEAIEKEKAKALEDGVELGQVGKESELDGKAGSSDEAKQKVVEKPGAKELGDGYEEHACYVLSRENGFRACAIRTFENPNFDRFFLTLIMCNCITLALFDPLDPKCETDKCQITGAFDKFFAIMFTVEMVTKMFAMGVCGDGAYFSTGWNRFDSFIVIAGLIDFIPGLEGGPLKSLRTFRVLRPLRAINKFPRMRVLVKLLMDTIPMLASVGMLCFLIFFVFGILAVQFWAGLFHQRCFNPNIPTKWSNYSAQFLNADVDGDDPYICSFGDGSERLGIATCAAAGDGDFTYCDKSGPLPFYGAISYDNILSAWIVLFQIITLEGWVDQMYLVMGSFSFHTGWIYFCTLVVVGAFFAVNLALVVISSQFSNTKGSEMDAIEASEKREKEERKRLEAEAKARGEKPSLWQLIRTGQLCSKSDEKLQAELDARLANLRSIAEKMEAGEAKTVVEEDIKFLASGNADDGFKWLPVTKAEAHAQGGIQKFRYSVREWDQQYVGNFIMACIALNVLLMATEYYDIKYDGPPPALKDFLEVANIVFCIIFAAEMCMKLFALGPSEYYGDNFNCFDCTVVIISFVELALGGKGLSALRMLRLVRVFRLVKFLPELQRQFMIMGETLGSVLSFLLLLGLFIFIFAVLGMFIFGGNLEFDEEDDYGKFKTTARKNFDTLLWALVTIFQTLTLEDWNVGMYSGVRGLGTQWGALYFILLIMTGNYIMFNLFVAILIDGFGSEEEAEEEEAAVPEEEEGLLGKSRRISKGDAAQALAAVSSLHAANLDPLGTQKGSGVGSGTGRIVWRRKGSSRRVSRGHQVAPMPIEAAQEDPPEITIHSNPSFGKGGGTGASPTGQAPDAAGVPELEGSTIVQTVTTDELATPEAPLVAGKLAPLDVESKYAPEAEKGKEVATPENDVKTPLTEENGESDPVDKNRCCGLYYRDYSCFCIPPTNGFRKFCDRCRLHPLFDQIVMTCICVNSITMAIERPSIQDDSTERIVLDVFGHFFTFVFSVELITKVIAMGIFIGPDVYWNSGWNRLDGTIVVISWLDLALTLAGVSGGMLSILKICRMFRALRPLRAISRLPGLKRVVNVLILSLSPIGTTLIIVGVFFFLFGVLGGQIFAGQFYHCDTEDRMELDQIVTREDCLRIVGPNAWINQPYNFDNLGNALMTLFVLSSIDGWVDIMYSGVDIVGIGKQPQENASEGLVFFFILFLLIGGFFIINMFVGVIVENFQKHGAPEPPDPNAPKEEEVPEPEPEIFEDTENYGPFRRAVLAHATSQCFETFIAIVIILNVVVMGSEHYNPDIATRENKWDGMSDDFKKFLQISNYIFTIIFVYELTVKYIAFGFRRFHCGAPPRSLWGWNALDWFIVFISVLGILFDDVIGAENLPMDPSILRILRILRVARILKLLKSAKDLIILLVTVSRSLAQVGNLGLLLGLLFFIYAALGIELFGRLACTDSNPCDGISEYANFENFGMAVLVLFRLSTGDNWNGMMKDGIRLTPPVSTDGNMTLKYNNIYGCDFTIACETDCCGGCDPSETCKENCCGNPAITPLYYISFCVLSTFVMLNLVVATLMGELERAGVEDAAEDAAKEAEEAALEKKDAPPALDTSGDNVATTGAVETFRAEDSPPSVESPVPSEPELSPGGSLTGDGDGPARGGVKLDPLPPLPMRPVSPSVFVPFAPELVQDQAQEGEDGASQQRVANSDAGRPEN